MKFNKIFVIVLIGLVGLVFLVFSSPLRQSEERIREDILMMTPLGSKFEYVLSILSKEKWEIRYVSESKGFYHQGVIPPKGVGDKSIKAFLGSYQGLPFKASVVVYWGFDADGKLIDIWVWKTWNGL